ncbi:unnamed protein product [Boreogadus saida]
MVLDPPALSGAWLKATGEEPENNDLRAPKTRPTGVEVFPAPPPETLCVCGRYGDIQSDPSRVNSSRGSLVFRSSFSGSHGRRAMGCSASKTVKEVEEQEGPEERPKSSCSARSRAEKQTDGASIHDRVEPVKNSS